MGRWYSRSRLQQLWGGALAIQTTGYLDLVGMGFDLCSV